MSEKVKQMIEQLHSLNVEDKDEFMEWIYEEYFNPWDSPEQRFQVSAIVEMYNRGELIYNDEDSY